jgi:Flp pilus assembly protein TadB
MRPVQPPSWRYLRKQAIIFFCIILVAFSVLNRSVPVAAMLAVIYTAIMLPLMWMTQRMVYRSYLKRTGQLPPPPPPRDRHSK